MKVLNSSKAFREHYTSRVPGAFDIAKAIAGGGLASSSVVGVSAWAAGTAATSASTWSMFASWPVIGGFAASKAAAAGWMAAAAVASSAAVVVPAVFIGAGIAYSICRNRKKRTFHKGSGIENLANAFAHVAWLPMFAKASEVCTDNPSNKSAVRDYVLKDMGAWGYAESYASELFSEVIKQTPIKISAAYDRAICQLESGSVEKIGATSAELPVGAVRGFADEFCHNFVRCIG